MIWDFDKPAAELLGDAGATLAHVRRAELVKDAAGFYPGERETGFPDFLRRARKHPDVTSPMTVGPEMFFSPGDSLPTKDQSAPLPWQ